MQGLDITVPFNSCKRKNLIAKYSVCTAIKHIDLLADILVSMATNSNNI